MVDIIESLKKKGWSEEDIRKTARIISEAPAEKSKTIILLDKVVYWAGLFLAIFGNFVISVLLIPFLILMGSFYLYLSLIFLGVVFGWVFSIIIQDIESIKSGQRLVAWLLIPAIAVINVYVMTTLSNQIAKLMGIETGIHTAPMVSVVYVLSFIFPYVLSKVLNKSSKGQSL